MANDPIEKDLNSQTSEASFRQGDRKIAIRIGKQIEAKLIDLMEKREWKWLIAIYIPFIISNCIFGYIFLFKEDKYKWIDNVIFFIMIAIMLYLLFLLSFIYLFGKKLEKETGDFKGFSAITSKTASETIDNVMKIKYAPIVIFPPLIVILCYIGYIIYYYFNKSFSVEDLDGNIAIRLVGGDEINDILDNGLGDILTKEAFTNPEITDSIQCSDISHYEDCFVGPTENRCNHKTESECIGEKYKTFNSPETEISICKWNADDQLCEPNTDIYNRNCTYEVSKDDVCSPFNEEIDFYSIHLKDIPYHHTPQKDINELSDDLKTFLKNILTSGNVYYTEKANPVPLTDIETRKITLSIHKKRVSELVNKEKEPYTTDKQVSQIPVYMFKISGYVDVIHIPLEMPASSDPTSASPTPHGYCSQLTPTFFKDENIYRCTHTDSEHKKKEEISKFCGIRNSDTNSNSNKCMSRYQGIVKEGGYYKVIPSKLCNIDGYNRDGTDEITQNAVFELMKNMNDSEDYEGPNVDGCTDLEILTDMGVTMKYGNFDIYTEENTIQNEIIEKIRKDFVIDKKNILTSVNKDGSELLKKEVSTDYDEFTGLPDSNFHTNYLFPLPKNHKVKDDLLWVGSDSYHNTKLIRTDPLLSYTDVVEEAPTEDPPVLDPPVPDPPVLALDPPVLDSPVLALDPPVLALDPPVPDLSLMCDEYACTSGTLIADAATTSQAGAPQANCCV